MLDFLFVYEHAQRELESIILLGTRLKQKGYSVEYLQIPISEVELPKRYFNNVRCVFAPCLYSNHELYMCVYRIAGKAKYVINLQWEQILTKEKDEDPKSFWFPKENAVNAVHLCWGEHSKNNLIKAGVPEGNVKVTGALNIDLLDKQFGSYFMSKDELFDEEDIQKDKKVILFISSFSAVNLDEYTYRHMCEVLGKESYDEFVRISTKSQKEIVQWLKKMANEGYTVIYRPHPNERLSDIVIEAKNTKGFYVNGTYSAKQWLRYADYLYTWISTTFVECNHIGIPCGILRPVKFPEEKDMCIFQGMQFIESYDELVDSINKDNYANDNARIIDSFILNDGSKAYDNIAGVIEEMFNDSSKCFLWDNELLARFEQEKKLENKSRRRIKTIFMLHKMIKAFHAQKLFKGLCEKNYNNRQILKEYADKRFDPLNDCIDGIEKKFEEIIKNR